MEQNVAILSKKIWNIVRVAIIMLKKGLCKKRILMDLRMMMKRGKIAGKTLKNLMFYNHHHLHHLFTSRSSIVAASNLPNDGREYEFSCSNTPLFQHYFTNKRKNRQNNNQCYVPSPLPLQDNENINIEDVNNMLEMMLRNDEVACHGVRPLRITDSPFPMFNVEGDKHVDRDAEDFINNFYSQLKQQI